MKRSLPAGSLNKATKQDIMKDDKSGKAVSRNSVSSISDRDLLSHASDGKQVGTTNVSSSRSEMHAVDSKADSGVVKSSEIRFSGGKNDSNEVSDAPRASSSRIVHSPRHDNSAAVSKSSDKLQKRNSPAEDPDRPSKRYKGDSEPRDVDIEVKLSDRERSQDPRFVDLEKTGTDEPNMYRSMDKPLDRSKDKGYDRYDRDHRERVDRPDKSRGDDVIAEKPRDRSMERYGRERSVERGQDRGSDRSFDKVKDDRNKDDRSKLRYSDSSSEKSYDDRFHGQNLPPPPPLPPHMIPQSVNTGRRDEDADRRFGNTRHSQRLSPRHDEKERRRSEENNLVSQDDTKRRREDEFRERKREERDLLSLKVSSRD